MSIIKRKRIVLVRYKPGKRKSMGSPFTTSPSLRITVGYQWIILGIPRPPRTASVYKAVASHGEERFVEDIDAIIKKLQKTYPWATRKVLEFLKKMRQFPSMDLDTQWAI